MRKCEKCGTVMRADLRLKVNGGGYGSRVWTYRNVFRGFN